MFGPSMRLLSLLFACLLTLSVAPLAADARSDAKKQVEFGIAVSARGLWREAIYRWERAAQIDPTYAAAQNNLAIAYEHEGELDKARAAYEKEFGEQPHVEVSHSSLELGLFRKKVPDIDMLSIGPEAFDVHTTRERLNHTTVDSTWRLLKALLSELRT